MCLLLDLTLLCGLPRFAPLSVGVHKGELGNRHTKDAAQQLGDVIILGLWLGVQDV